VPASGCQSLVPVFFRRCPGWIIKIRKASLNGRSHPAGQGRADGAEGDPRSGGRCPDPASGSPRGQLAGSRPAAPPPAAPGSVTIPGQQVILRALDLREPKFFDFTPPAN
jgi:hypothetical protein